MFVENLTAQQTWKLGDFGRSRKLKMSQSNKASLCVSAYMQLYYGCT